MTDLPTGWEWTTLGDLVTRIEAGRSFGAAARPARDEEWGIIRVSAMTWGEFRANENKAVLDSSNVNPDHEIRPGDVLVSRANTAGYVGAPVLVGATRSRLLLSDKSLRLVVPDSIDRRWLVQILSSPDVRRQISDQATGTKDSMRNIPQSKLREVRIPLPPLCEQRRIVVTLDEHLATLGSGTASLTAAHAGVERLEGRVAEEALRNLGKVSYSLLGELLREPLRNGFSGRATQAEDGIRTLTLSAVTQNEFSNRYTKIADVGVRDTESLWLADGDVFIQRSNTPDLVGTSAVYRGGERWAIYPDLLTRVRPVSTIIPEFLLAVLSSARVRDELRDSAKGLAGSMPKIDHGTVARLQIPVVPIAQQVRLVNEIADARSYSSRLSSALDAATNRSTQLRCALLEEAFAGRLVPQGPEDEPASVLLDRIRMERG